jgi:hypothetical protein
MVPGKIDRSQDGGGRLDCRTNVADLSQAPCSEFFLSGTPPVGATDSTDSLWLSLGSLKGAEDIPRVGVIIGVVTSCKLPGFGAMSERYYIGAEENDWATACLSYRRV